jgi:hypothetical protein
VEEALSNVTNEPTLALSSFLTLTLSMIIPVRQVIVAPVVRHIEAQL